MADKEVAIKVENLTKTFKIPLEAHSGLKQKLINTIKGRKGYREFTPLKDISFEIEKGDFFGIVGRNGSGKSTLLKSLAGIYTPNKGAVHVNGSLVPFIELGVGFNPELTGRENVFLNGALLGFSRKQMEGMYDDIVDFAELHDFMEERLKNYSSGMQVRLAFSIAIRAEGDILLLDEVLAVGDEAFQKKCNDYFDQLKENGKTVVLVTHSMDAVRRYCNKALLLKDGSIVASGDPNEIADDYSMQFIKQVVTKTAAPIQEETRYGTGEVKYENITFRQTRKWFLLDFDIKNYTDKDIKTITMGFDFCIKNDIIYGNDTRYMDKYKHGITLGAKKRKHFTLKFENNFGNYDFKLNANITTNLGTNITDHIKPALEFSSDNVKYSKAFKILSFPEITETDNN